MMQKAPAIVVRCGGGAWCHGVASKKMLPYTTTTSNFLSKQRHFSNSQWHGKEFRPIDAFGIVAAICSPSNDGDEKTNHNENNNASGQQRSRGIIGINSKLPWGSLPKDRAIFEDLTRDRITIVGRKTLLEECDGSLDHMRHARHCIVVSNSISSLDKDPRLRPDKSNSNDDDFKFLELARSFGEALDRARELATTTTTTTEEEGLFDDDETNNSIRCWVIGGERLYDEAIQHPFALEVHLSVIDAKVDVSPEDYVARFPAKHEWGHNYKLARETFFPPESATNQDDDDNSKQQHPDYPGFVYHVYKRDT